MKRKRTVKQLLSEGWKWNSIGKCWNCKYTELGSTVFGALDPAIANSPCLNCGRPLERKTGLVRRDRNNHLQIIPWEDFV